VTGQPKAPKNIFWLKKWFICEFVTKNILIFFWKQVCSTIRASIRPISPYHRFLWFDLKKNTLKKMFWTFFICFSHFYQISTPNSPKDHVYDAKKWFYHLELFICHILAELKKNIEHFFCKVKNHSKRLKYVDFKGKMGL
jgi:hypothetical protein